MICCNRKDSQNTQCISYNEELRQHVLNEIEKSSEWHKTRTSWLGKEKFPLNNKTNDTQFRNCDIDKGIILDHRTLDLDDNVPEITLILHGRLSDLDRYGKLRTKFDLYKMFDNLLSVHFMACNVYHTGMMSLVEHNKGN